MNYSNFFIVLCKSILISCSAYGSNARTLKSLRAIFGTSENIVSNIKASLSKESMYLIKQKKLKMLLVDKNNLNKREEENLIHCLMNHYFKNNTEIHINEIENQNNNLDDMYSAVATIKQFCASRDTATIKKTIDETSQQFYQALNEIISIFENNSTELEKKNKKKYSAFIKQYKTEYKKNLSEFIKTKEKFFPIRLPANTKTNFIKNLDKSKNNIIQETHNLLQSIKTNKDLTLFINLGINHIDTIHTKIINSIKNSDTTPSQNIHDSLFQIAADEILSEYAFDSKLDVDKRRMSVIEHLYNRRKTIHTKIKKYIEEIKSIIARKPLENIDIENDNFSPSTQDKFTYALKNLINKEEFMQKIISSYLQNEKFMDKIFKIYVENKSPSQLTKKFYASSIQALQLIKPENIFQRICQLDKKEFAEEFRVKSNAEDMIDIFGIQLLKNEPHFKIIKNILYKKSSAKENFKKQSFMAKYKKPLLYIFGGMLITTSVWHNKQFFKNRRPNNYRF